MVQTSITIVSLHCQHYERDVSKDPHVKNATSLLHSAPNLSVPQAILAEKIAQAQRNNPGMKMWICFHMQLNTSTTSTTIPNPIGISYSHTILSYLSQSKTSTTPTKLNTTLKKQGKTSIATHQARMNHKAIKNKQKHAH